MHKNRRWAEVVAALVFLVVASVLFAVSLSYKLWLPGTKTPNAGLFPAIISLATIIAAATWLVLSLRGTHPAVEAAGAGLGAPSIVTDGPAKAPTGSAEPGSAVDVQVETELEEIEAGLEELDTIDRAGYVRIGLIIVWALVPILFMEQIGFIFTFAIYLFGMLIAVARTRIWVAALGAVAVALVLGKGADMLGVVLPDPAHILDLIPF